MKIAIVTPVSAGSRKGNRVTALRWARLLRQLGHRVTVRHEYRDQRDDLLIALHARRSFPAVESWRQAHPDHPIIVALTGTDVYQDIHTDKDARQALEWASRLVVLQPLALDELAARLRKKTRVIYQSAVAPAVRATARPGVFEVCVLGHLRPVKDPLRAALASRLLPASSRLRVLHLGAALSPDMEKQVREEMSANPRYRWLGDLPRWKALRILARSRLLVQSSLLEGGANAISEAIAASVPVLSSAIPGSVGILGPDYPGYFPVGDTRALAALLLRAEIDSRFYDLLKASHRRLRRLVDPARERARWRRVLRELPVPHRKTKGV
ncbi:MAG: TIGR04348 family glycosyltransferase [Planctomycetia bacterium]|nr:TIGR04348 family glycosyltransferase [Planctomycetia bacterium]